MAIEEIIKYEGSNHTFIWKHPIEDFNIGTQLIVHESQEAIFFLNGQALGLFTAGRHTLETQNIPFLKNIIKEQLTTNPHSVKKTKKVGYIEGGSIAEIKDISKIKGTRRKLK